MCVFLLRGIFFWNVFLKLFRFPHRFMLHFGICEWLWQQQKWQHTSKIDVRLLVIFSLPWDETALERAKSILFAAMITGRVRIKSISCSDISNCSTRVYDALSTQEYTKTNASAFSNSSCWCVTSLPCLKRCFRNTVEFGEFRRFSFSAVKIYLEQQRSTNTTARNKKKTGKNEWDLFW